MVVGTNSTQVCIVGGGPAGMILALELAKKGVQVKVLEKNENFDREFRGEVLQPRFFRALEQVGLVKLVQSLPHEKFSMLRFFFKGMPVGFIPVGLADFKYPYITWMTQPILLNGLYEEAKTYANFSMEFGVTVNDLIKDGSVCRGVVYVKGGEKKELAADITVGADGRFSLLRRLGSFEYAYKIDNLDVIWFEIERPQRSKPAAQFFFTTDQLCLILPKFPDKIQCGLILAKGKVRKYLAGDHAYVAASIKKIHPLFKEIGAQISGSKSFTVLNAKIELIKDWSKDGLLLIGDAAHTCSPAGAIGVTIAAETAIAAASVIADAVGKKDFSNDILSQVQKMRIGEVRRIHFGQRLVHRLLLNPLTHALVPLFIAIGSLLFIAPLAARAFISRSSPIVRKR